MLKVLLALAVLGGLGWLVWDQLGDEGTDLGPREVRVETPSPFGGEPDPDDTIYIP